MSFQNEAILWNITNSPSTAITYICTGSILLGGYGIVGSGTTLTRQYLSLPAHSSIYFHFDTWLIDTLAYTDVFKIYFDNQLIQDINTNGADTSTYPTWMNYCGGSQVDFPSILIDGQAIHSSSSLKINITSMLSGTYSFGIRNFTVLFQTNPVPSNQVCQIISTTSTSVSCVCPNWSV